MTSATIIRPARPDEAGVLTDLVLRSKAYWGYSEEFMESCRAELTVRPEDVVAKRTTVATTDDGRIVGVAMFTGEPPHGELDGLFVAPEAIGKGYGSRLFHHVADTARAAGHPCLELTADPNAEPFYEALGAVRIGTEPSGSIPGRVLNRYSYRL
ncbi:GNAT family N-acetyltransferase [Catenulispora subtropica]|uniref:GNAT family N-acetyltransferase n=1 Tax=Catenulispora subtropica TaxID=450798 RepID=A0ABN2QHT3_9ACTN